MKFCPVSLFMHWFHRLDHQLKATDSSFAPLKTVTLQPYLPCVPGQK
jgi:hypothetical protein